MELYSSIFTRKSTRSFTQTPLPKETIKEFRAFIETIKPLLPNARVTYEIAGPEAVKGMGIPQAPHYVLIYGAEDQPLREACAGFLFQHFALYLHAQGYASCWLSGLKPNVSQANYIAGMAFGASEEAVSRKAADFDRKPLKKIAEGKDPRLEAARLAPSGLNGQPWYFIAANGAIYVYRHKKINGLPGLMYKLTELDTGIALCHLAVATEHSGKVFEFIIRKGAPVVADDVIYLGTVK